MYKEKRKQGAKQRGKSNLCTIILFNTINREEKEEGKSHFDLRKRGVVVSKVNSNTNMMIKEN